MDAGDMPPGALPHSARTAAAATALAVMADAFIVFSLLGLHCVRCPGLDVSAGIAVRLSS